MADEKLIRLERLEAALDAKHIPEKERSRYLSEKCQPGGISFYSGLRAGDRSFGEKVARRIETGLGLPPGYLDKIGPSLYALEIAELFDLMDEKAQKVMRATANALIVPVGPGDGAQPPAAPNPKPARPGRTLDA